MQPTVGHEVQEKIKRRYLERLAQKVKKIRRDLLERNWQQLRVECQHLRESAEGFGFLDLVKNAERAESTIPQGNIPKAKILPGARQAFEHLTSVIDDLLTAHAIFRE